MKLFEIGDLTELERTKVRHYFQLEQKLRSFEISCTSDTFIKLFGEKEGARLREHFVSSCGGSLAKWFTYITSDQKDLFWVQIIKYENLAKEII